MAEGGQLPWKVQKVDESRGPPADYSCLASPLPSPPSGVEWRRDEETREWRLVRVDDEDAKKRRYRLEVGTAWNEREGRAAPTLVPVPRREDDGLHLPPAEDDSITGKRNDKSVTGGEAAGGGPEAAASSEKPAVEGVDYLTHTVLPTDTLPGLCLRYRLKPTALRRLNRFSGSNLHLAPSRLIVPLGPNGEGLNGGSVRAQDQSTPEFKLHAFLALFPHLRQSEGRAYLEIAGWDLSEALESAKEDECWERTEGKSISKQEKDCVEEAEVALDELALGRSEDAVGCWGGKGGKARSTGSRLDVHVAVPAVGIELIEPVSNGARTSAGGRDEEMVPAPPTVGGGVGDGENLRAPLLRKFELPQIT